MMMYMCVCIYIVMNKTINIFLPFFVNLFQIFCQKKKKKNSTFFVEKLKGIVFNGMVYMYMSCATNVH